MSDKDNSGGKTEPKLDPPPREEPPKPPPKPDRPLAPDEVWYDDDSMTELNL